MIPQPVNDPADPRLHDYLGLTDPARRRARETGSGVFLAEGRLVVERLLSSGLTVRSVLVTEDRLAALAPSLSGLGRDVPVLTVGRDLARQVTGYDVHRGILAAAERPDPMGLDSLLDGATTLVALEDLTDQENIGSVFRSAAGLGADGVLLSPGCGDPLYRRAVRVSMGAVLTMPFCRVGPWPQGLERLEKAGFAVVGMTPDPAAEKLEDLAEACPRRVALILGSEGPGLSDATLAACSRRVRIDMAPGADSLNVATAAAIALYALRRRRV